MSSPSSRQSIVFVGDFVSPRRSPAKLARFSRWVGGDLLVANLEGPVLAADNAKPRWQLKYSLASSRDFLAGIDRASYAFSIANNHYEDFREDVRLDITKAAGIRTLGQAGFEPMHERIGDREVVLVGGVFPSTDPWRWRVRDASAFAAPSAALKKLEDIRKRHPQALLIFYVHWGYELSALPYPADRAWSRRAIEGGVDLVVGHHSHVPQPVETFAGGTVAHSVGNFYLPWGEFFGKRLVHGEATYRGLALRYNGKAVALYLTRADYQSGDVDVAPAEVERPDLCKPVFAGYSDREYLAFFRDQVKQGVTRVPQHVPILETYFSALGLKERSFLWWTDTRQLGRDLLIVLGVHNPFAAPSAAARQDAGKA